MKITTPARALIVILSLVMVFSLFACAEEQTTLTDAPGTDAPTEAPTEAPEETNGATEAPTGATTEAPTSEVTEAPTEDTTVETTEKETTEEETTEEETTVPACEHEEEVVTGKAATCTEAGLTDGKKCSKCGETILAQEVIPATGHTEEDIAAVAPTCTATALTAGKKCTVCQTVTVEQTVAAATGHAWDAGTTAEGVKCGDTADVTFKCTNDGCDATDVQTGATVEHAWSETTRTNATCTTAGSISYECTRGDCEETKTEPIEIDPTAHSLTPVEATNVTCLVDGNVAYNHCELCEKNYDDLGEEIADVVIVAKGHVEEILEAVAPTCSATGLTEGKKCSVCGDTIVAQDELAIVADAHKWIDVPAKKPAPHEDGYDAYKDCEYCDKVADTDGNVIESITTYPGLDCEVYFDAEKIYNTYFSQGSKVNKTLAEDGSYIRYECTADFTDGYMELVADNDKVTGQYMVFKYRTDIKKMENGISGVGVWANTLANGHDDGKANSSITYNADGNWHIAVIDLSTKIAAYVKPAEDGTYTLKWARLDFIDNATTGGFFELAFIMLCDDLSDVAFALDEADKSACTHQYLDIDETCHGECCFCRADMGLQHNLKETYVDNGTTRTYTKSCVNCDSEPVYSYTVEFGEERPNVFINAGTIFEKGGVNSCDKTFSEDGTYMTFTDKSGAAEGYWHVYIGDGSVTGQYLLIKYRTKHATTEMYLGANNGRTGAAGGDEFYFNPFKDGEWQVVVIDMSKSANFNANEDETYSAAYIRWDIFNGTGTGSRTVDVAYVAIADDLDKLLAIDDLDAYTAYWTTNGKTGAMAPTSAKTGTIHFSPSLLKDRSQKATIMHDTVNGNMPFVRYNGLGDGNEDRFVLWTSNSHSRSVANTGNYLVYMYRKSATATADFADVFISSNLTGPNGSGDSISKLTYTNDGQWHVVVVDLAKVMGKDKYEAGTVQSYYDPAEGITSLAIDWLNLDTASTDAYVDVAFVAFCDTSDEAIEYIQGYYDKYFTEDCTHGCTDKNYHLAVDDKAETYAAKKADTCLICGSAATPSAVKVKFNMDTFTGNVTKSGVSGTYDAAANGLTATADGKVSLYGWAGADLKFSKLAFRILDADGNVLKDWTAAGNANKTEEAAVIKLVNDAGCDGSTSCRISMSVNLSEYIADYENVTVEFALRIDDVPEGSNDNIVHMFTVKNICAYVAPPAEG